VGRGVAARAAVRPRGRAPDLHGGERALQGRPIALSIRTGSAASLLASLLATACASDGATARPAAPASATNSGWTLVFSDEFETPGSLDPAKWSYELGYIRNKEAQYYTSRPENVRAEGGNLVIEARREPYEGYAYTSASVNPLGRFEFLRGRVEVRAKLPAGVGAWPAVWTLGTNRFKVGWPACGEIDIMENVGFDPLRIHGSVHTAAYNHVIRTQRTASVTIADPSRDFHVYAMEWHTDRIEVSVDGQPFFAFENEGTGARAWPFDEPQYLLINLAIGGSWGGQKGIDDTLFPHRYLVDYVRIYRRQ
jgi:beta-glucanase (GH16 family)